MGLFSFFKRPPGAVAAPANVDATQIVATARTRARRRLIGAVVLLGVGVIAFPLLFETQPRPIPVDIPIEIPRKEGAPPLTLPQPRPLPASAAIAISAPKVEAGKEAATPAAAAGKEVVTPSAPPTKPAARPEPRADVTVSTQPAAVVAPEPDKAAKSTPDTAGRFVVQVGAFAGIAGAREARAKVEKLGLHTYTQAVDTDNGQRIRVRLGPFTTREEADKAAARVKAAGLPAAVLSL